MRLVFYTEPYISEGCGMYLSAPVFRKVRYFGTHQNRSVPEGSRKEKYGFPKAEPEVFFMCVMCWKQP